MKKKLVAVVTGGAGFIGSHMVDLLIKKNFIVRSIDNLVGGHKKNLFQHNKNKKFFLIKKDICKIKKNDPIFKGVDYVFHFAGIGDIVPSIDNPTSYFETNVQGTVKVLEACRYNKVKKFIYAASSSCYGLAKVPTKEDHEISPQYPYALSKYLGEKATLHWNQVYNLPVSSIRIFNAYGTRVRTTGAYGAVFGVFFKQKIDGLPFTVVGNGSQKRDFLYVTDVARAFLAVAMSKKNGEIYNLGAGDPQSINKLVKLIGGAIIYIPKRPGEPDCTWANIAKISKDTDWKPLINFEKGVHLMMEELDKWKNAPLWTPKKIEKATKNWFKFMENNS